MLEIEVKFFTPDLALIREEIERYPHKKSEKVFEINQLYEDKQQNLQKKRALLRLRKDQGVRLTFKQDIEKNNTEFKILNEIEVGVSDFGKMHDILSGIGFHPERCYEKYRETYEIKGVTVCLDTLPFGSFTELEGEKSAIRNCADRLSFSWQKRITVNYLHIFDALRKHYALPFTDITFDLFKEYPLDFSKDMVQFEAEQNTDWGY